MSAEASKAGGAPTEAHPSGLAAPATVAAPSLSTKVAEFRHAQETVEARVRGFQAAVNAEFKKLDDIVLSISSQRKELARLHDQLRAANTEEARTALAALDREGTDRTLYELNKLVAPDSGGIFSRYFLGDVNCKVYLDRERYLIKSEYENFKAKTVIPFMLLVALSWYKPKSVIPHTLLQVWCLYYFSSLSLRENILRVNGSTIRTWWVQHHYLSSLLSLVLIFWPVNSLSFQQFQPLFFTFSFCQVLVQILLNMYQRGRLYNLVALGKASPMDVTGEASVPPSPHRWHIPVMVLYPFVLFVQGMQLFISYRLAMIAWADHFVEWQVIAASAMFAVLAIGNFVTTNASYFQKYKLWRQGHPKAVHWTMRSAVREEKHDKSN